MRTLNHGLPLLAPLALCLACDADTPTGFPAPVPGPASPSFAGSLWSEPVNLGPPINTPVTDGNAVLSPDGLSLYYDSDRTDLPGARGARDLWVSRRACDHALEPACAWQTPRNLGPLINTPYVDLTPEISDDGHLLFFASHTTRDDCPADPAAPDPTRPCDEDIFVSWRADPTDDLGWSAPVRLGPEVNSKVGDNAPEYVAAAEPGSGNLYFNRAIGGTARGFDIYYAPIRVTRRGDPSGLHVRALGPAVPVAELNLANVFDGGATIRADGREMFFHSALQRPGLGAVDLWTSTRATPLDPWSPPINLGAPLNSTLVDLSPRLSHDGRTLILTSNRQGPPGPLGWDIYMSTRTRAPDER